MGAARLELVARGEGAILEQRVRRSAEKNGGVSDRKATEKKEGRLGGEEGEAPPVF